jgi:hypothetical protein
MMFARPKELGREKYPGLASLPDGVTSSVRVRSDETEVNYLTEPYDLSTRPATSR